MDIKEAKEWIDGKRSTMNIVPIDPLATWQERIAKADAALCEQAYWIIRAHKEFLFSRDE